MTKAKGETKAKDQLKIKNKKTGNVFYIPVKLWEEKSKLDKADFEKAK